MQYSHPLKLRRCFLGATLRYDKAWLRLHKFPFGGDINLLLIQLRQLGYSDPIKVSSSSAKSDTIRNAEGVKIHRPIKTVMSRR